MFESLSNRLDRTLKNLRGLGRLTEHNIKDTVRDIRINLLEADVALPVITSFVENVTQKALGQEVMQSLSPGQELIRIVRDEITTMLGSEHSDLQLNAVPPVVILMAGLQGSGKTTTSAKLAKWLQETHKKTVTLVSCDIYRPAAIEQLEILAKDIGAHFHQAQSTQHPIDIARDALDSAQRNMSDVLIIDTAGRLHIDAEMMAEIQAIERATSPTETLFVVDSMTGQDAAHTAKAFNDALTLTGIVLTKADGDTRGGAALSMSAITGKAIKFIGTGEKLQGLEVFYPERMASRILGMGDVLSLIEEAEKLNQSNNNLSKKLKKGKTFDLEDFRDQIQQVSKMGGIASILKKLPGMGHLGAMTGGNSDVEQRFVRIEAMINSMTPQERQHPLLIKHSRKQRIAKGSGTTPQAINQLLKQFEQMQKMMKKVSQKGGLKNMMRGMGSMPMGGGFPDMAAFQNMMPSGMQKDLEKLIKGDS